MNRYHYPIQIFMFICNSSLVSAARFAIITRNVKINFD